MPRPPSVIAATILLALLGAPWALLGLGMLAWGLLSGIHFLVGASVFWMLVGAVFLGIALAVFRGHRLARRAVRLLVWLLVPMVGFAVMAGLPSTHEPVALFAIGAGIVLLLFAALAAVDRPSAVAYFAARAGTASTESTPRSSPP